MRIIYLLLLVPTLCYGKFNLTICAIFRDDAEFLKEWIDFHRLQGVEHFYLYNNLSEDHYQEVLKPYIDQKIVSLIEWPHASNNIREWNHIQCSAYRECLKDFGKKTKWMAFLDTDEFLFCPTGQKLPSFLKKYKDFGSVGVNWVMFGTNDVETIPEGKLLIEMLTKRAPINYGPNRHVKSIVQPKHVSDCISPHFCRLKPWKFHVDENFHLVQKNVATENVSVKKIRINHYWTRTEHFFRTTKLFRQDNWNRITQQEMERLLKTKEELNMEEDHCILQFVDRMSDENNFANLKSKVKIAKTKAKIPEQFLLQNMRF